jgi:hypothetical protein
MVRLGLFWEFCCGKILDRPEENDNGLKLFWRKEISSGSLAGDFRFNHLGGPEITIQRVGCGVQNQAAVRTAFQVGGNFMLDVGRQTVL